MFPSLPHGVEHDKTSTGNNVFYFTQGFRIESLLHQTYHENELCEATIERGS